MKLILSRKGFDSENGGCASPIFPDGSMLSLPIPFKNSGRAMEEATLGNRHFTNHDVLSDLSGGTYTAKSEVHLDPYLNRDMANAPVCWRRAFGQDGSAQGHLDAERVGPGDLFLFFGWFREVELGRDRAGKVKWQYKRTSPDVHVLFGWLQVAAVVRVGSGPNLGPAIHWLPDHPHVQNASLMGTPNTVYVAADQLELSGRQNCSGGGVFLNYKIERQLTAPGAKSRSIWQLPHWFHPAAHSAPTLSYHRDEGRWTHQGRTTKLRVVNKGQEFVVDLQGARKKGANAWLKSIFQ